MENKIYSVTGLFDTPDEIINAAEAISNAGYKQYDINTPYPVHGMDNTMKLKPSKLGYFALAFGLSGTAIALLTMYWITKINYPLVIGGKPFFSLPALIPITFEVTVLLASIGTVTTMLFLFFRFPNNSHPLQDSNYLKKVSIDKFGVCIEANDKIFNEEKVKEFLKNLGAKDINSIYYDNKESNKFVKIYSPKFVTFLLTVFVITGIISYYTLNILLYQVPFNWMAIQARVNTQSHSTFFADGFGMRMPVEGTVAKGFMPYQFKGKPEEAAKSLVNPLLPTNENLNLGKRKFLTYCSPCHGNFGQGDGREQIKKYIAAPTLHSEKVKNWQDGSIYHVITEGQNLMPSYATQITREERWAVILYLRSLQRALNAKEEDVK